MEIIDVAESLELLKQILVIQHSDNDRDELALLVGRFLELVPMPYEKRTHAQLSMMET